MITDESFHTNSLDAEPNGAAVRRILAAALAAVEPGAAVRRFVKRSGEVLEIGGRRYDLTSYGRVFLLGVGKAAAGMSVAMADLLGKDLDEALLVVKHAPGQALPFKHTLLVGGHPVPDENSLLAGSRVVEFVSRLGVKDLLICLISGGGSALMTAPVDGVSLGDLQALTGALLACGARIEEINGLRKRLDRVKGGGLARLANGAGIVSLILSDVVGNPLEAIASGPTAPTPGGGPTVAEVLQKYNMLGKIPPAVQAALLASPQPPGPEDPLFEQVHHVIVGSALLAAQAALAQAVQEGFNPYLLRLDLQGEARQVAFELATTLRQAWLTGDPAPRPACIVAGGETTVTLHGTGKGGRNSELALGAVYELAEFKGVMLVTLATDGEDGPTDGAGAVVTGETLRRARALGLDPVLSLERNDSYPFFEALGDLLKTGPSGTNVNDLVFLVTF